MFAIEVTSSALAYCSLALFLGCLMTASLLLPGGEPGDLRRQLFSLAVKLLALFVIASVISLVIQGTKLNGGTFPTFEILSRYVLHTQSGKIWIVREIYALLLLGGMFWYGREQHNLTDLRVLLFYHCRSSPAAALRAMPSQCGKTRHWPFQRTRCIF
jgi:putative copper export protein